MSDSKATRTNTRKYRWLKILGIVVGIFLLIPVLLYVFTNESLPDGQAGPEADALAEKMMRAINHEAWKATGAISWNFAGRHDFVWDKDRHYTQVKWENNEVLVNINERTGIARTDGNIVEGDPGKALVNTAWEYWVNDSFWLNPVSKAFDPGTSRKLVELEGGQKGIMVSYDSGGVTPGDSYLWVLDENGLPSSWKMWVNIIPIGGIETTWENWEEQSTGVKISTLHNGPMGLALPVSNVEADSTLEALVGNPDIFAELE